MATIQSVLADTAKTAPHFPQQVHGSRSVPPADHAPFISSISKKCSTLVPTVKLASFCQNARRVQPSSTASSLADTRSASVAGPARRPLSLRSAFIRTGFKKSADWRTRPVSSSRRLAALRRLATSRSYRFSAHRPNWLRSVKTRVVFNHRPPPLPDTGLRSVARPARRPLTLRSAFIRTGFKKSADADHPAPPPISSSRRLAALRRLSASRS